MTYIKTQVDSKVTEHLYLWLKAQSEREIYIEKIIQCLKNIFKDSDWHLKAQKQLKKLKMSYFKNFNTFQSEFLRLINSAKMSANQWELQIKQSALKFKRKTMTTTTTVAHKVTRSVLTDIICYICNKKEHLMRDCSDKLKKTEIKAVESDHSDSENELL